ncbi:MAG: transketolase C-terminal domain-containing protein, partial [Gemmatimonadota bacterium]
LAERGLAPSRSRAQALILAGRVMLEGTVESKAGTQVSETAEIEIIDLRSIRPLDIEAIVDSVRRTGRLLIVHEAPRFGGFAGEITAQVCEEAFEWLDAPIRRVTAMDTPVPYAPTLEDRYLPQTEDIVAAARWLLAY